jgi:SAM-dependent methyltransferase
MSAHPYLLANAETQAADRFQALKALYNEATFASLERLGISPSWRCWEVGAGGPSVPEWMAGRVMPKGHVVATDIDTTWLSTKMDGVEIRKHDAAAEEPPGQNLDLVHARLVLSHVPARDHALLRMISSLKPGGYVVIEDFDSVIAPMACLENSTPDERRANKIRAGFCSLLELRGVDRAYGSRLPRLLAEAGLKDIRAEARMPVIHSGAAQLERANVAQTAPLLIKNGYASEADISDHLAAIDAGRITIVFPPMFTASGKRA